MYKPHFGTCLGPCGKDNQLLPVKDGFCMVCNHERKQAKKKLKSSAPKKNYFIKTPSGEAKIFEEIWAERDHLCFVCGAVIHYPIAANFSHILSKALNKYPLFRLYKPSIQLMCYDLKNPSCHYKLDHTPKSELIGEGWEKVFKLQEELKVEYEAFKSAMNK